MGLCSLIPVPLYTWLLLNMLISLTVSPCFFLVALDFHYIPLPVISHPSFPWVCKLPEILISNLSKLCQFSISAQSGKSGTCPLCRPQASQNMPVLSIPREELGIGQFLRTLAHTYQEGVGQAKTIGNSAVLIAFKMQQLNAAATIFCFGYLVYPCGNEVWSLLLHYLT